MVENGHFGQKWPFWPKMAILAKNDHFSARTDFWLELPKTDELRMWSI